MMKRRKIMLIALAVVAAIGGVLSFKAQTVVHYNVWCATFEGGAVTCKLTDFKTTNSGPFFSTPCEVPHAVLGITTTSCYTTATCPMLVSATVTKTIIQ